MVLSFTNFNPYNSLGCENQDKKMARFFIEFHNPSELFGLSN